METGMVKDPVSSLSVPSPFEIGFLCVALWPSWNILCRPGWHQTRVPPLYSGCLLVRLRITGLQMLVQSVLYGWGLRHRLLGNAGRALCCPHCLLSPQSVQLGVCCSNPNAAYAEFCHIHFLVFQCIPSSMGHWEEAEKDECSSFYKFRVLYHVSRALSVGCGATLCWSVQAVFSLPQAFLIILLPRACSSGQWE